MSYGSRRGGLLGMIPPVVKYLLIINIALYLLAELLRSSGTVDLWEVLALYYFDNDNFEPYQYISHMFMHGGFMHLFFNMFALYMFGRILENLWGPKRFFTYYMITGLGAAALHIMVMWWQISTLEQDIANYIQSPNIEAFEEFIDDYPIYKEKMLERNLLKPWSENPENQALIDQSVQYVKYTAVAKKSVPTVGASGAIFGLLLAFGMFFPNVELMMIFLPIPIKAKYFVILYGIAELFFGVANFSGDNIAHFAHLGGMIFGFIMIKIWQKDHRTPYQT